MFKGHPKGLYVLALSNMGERFGYYTMLAIFTLFLQDHFGMDETASAGLYGIFLAGIYFLPLLGGIIADAGFGYGKTVIVGLFTMMGGYLLLSQAQNHLMVLYIALFVIALGVGFFKGNVAVIVGNLYERSEKSHLRDAAFNIYYMFINIGAFFAPHLAGYLKVTLLGNSGFVYDPSIPKIAHDVLNNVASPEQLQNITRFAHGAEIRAFAQHYIDAISNGYSWGFAAAGFSMIISLAIFLVFRKSYKESDYLHKNKKATGAPVVELTPKQTKDRIFALILVFIIVIFFWMAFHQNGSTLTFFAKNYTHLSVSKYTFLLFNVPTLLSIFAIIIGIAINFGKQAKMNSRILGLLMIAGGGTWIGISLSRFTSAEVGPELFQAFNPMFVVFLTFVIVAFFTFLRKRNKEPNPPTKIGYGMIITAVGFGIMLIASTGLPSVASTGGNAITGIPEYAGMAVSPYWLISIYFTLTIAELFTSPMGLSFVAKVAPPKLRGTMQAGWLAATACGNYLAGFIGRFYQKWELWQFFLLIIVIALLSAIIMFSIMKIINRASES
jgi:proton-dependent oligopeptide transporter, POT family